MIGVVLVLAGWLGLKESLPPERRVVGGLVTTLRGFGVLIRDRFFVGVALAAGLAGASLFAYIAGATFVLQRIYGLSPQGFSLVFGVNSVGIMAAAQLSARLTRRWSPVRVLAIGLAVNLTGALCLAATVLLGLGLPFVLVSLFVMVSAIGMILPTSTALALANYPERGGHRVGAAGPAAVPGRAAWPPRWSAWRGEDTAVPLGVVAGLGQRRAPAWCSPCSSVPADPGPAPHGAVRDAPNRRRAAGDDPSMTRDDRPELDAARRQSETRCPQPTRAAVSTDFGDPGRSGSAYACFPAEVRMPQNGVQTAGRPARRGSGVRGAGASGLGGAWTRNWRCPLGEIDIVAAEADGPGGHAGLL